MPVRRILYHDLPVHAATKRLNARVWIKGVSKNVDRQIMDLMKKTSGGWDPAVEASGSAYCSLRKTPINAMPEPAVEKFPFPASFQSTIFCQGLDHSTWQDCL
jgi:hypothetical protein